MFAKLDCSILGHMLMRKLWVVRGVGKRPVETARRLATHALAEGHSATPGHPCVCWGVQREGSPDVLTKSHRGMPLEPTPPSPPSFCCSC